MKLGVHFTIAKGFTYAAKTVLAMGGDTFQFFCRNPRGSQIKEYDAKDIASFQQIRSEHKMGPFLAHAPYTINLASAQEEISRFARESMKEDLFRMEQIGIEYLNVHPGSYVKSSTDAGIKQIISNINDALSGSNEIMLLLETMSGKGTEIGYRFEHLRRIMDGIEQRDRIGICMDLCHMYSSGYDLVNDFQKVLDQFNNCIGINHLKTVHLNDTVFGKGERKDRHMPVGEGKMGMPAIIELMAHPQMRDLPFYLETPLDDEGHRLEIGKIRDLFSQRINQDTSR